MCIHGLYFFDPTNGIEKDDKGYYRIWYCGKCGQTFKTRNLKER